VQHDQVDRDEREELREHLDQQQREHPHPAPAEAEAAERVRGERAEEDAGDRGGAGDDDRVHVPARVVRLRGALGLLLRRPLEQLAEVVERHVIRDQLRAAQRLHLVERRRGDVGEREERPEHEHDRDRVTPPVGACAGAPPALALRRDGRPDRVLGLIRSGHATFSSAFVRQNAIVEMVATITKMKIEIVAASA
jgi:hypothetical protein